MTSCTGMWASVSLGKWYSRKIIAFDDTICVYVGGGGKQQPPVGHGLFIHDVSKSHTATQESW